MHIATIAAREMGSSALIDPDRDVIPVHSVESEFAGNAMALRAEH